MWHDGDKCQQRGPSDSNITAFVLCHLQDFKNKASTEALALLDQSVANVQALQSLHDELFPYAKLSEASAEFIKSASSGTNVNVSKAVVGTLDQVDATAQMARTLEYFITLHIPMIEDGGNFGVGVQLDLVKKLGEISDNLKADTESLLGYEAARADALGKLNLPSASTTITKSSSATTTDGKKEEKSSESTEEKQSSAPPSGAVYEGKLATVAAVDTLYYSKARGVFQSCILHVMSAMDFMDKNKEKLLQPKGNGGHSSGYSSMY
ncbi:MAG: hypothetical protein SGILL_010150 [Bacillariaceae sp.]